MAFHYSAKEFIKVYRKLLDWEWYTDVKTKTLFLHCLLRANWKAGEWHGIHYDEGEFITSLPSISRETGLSIRQARSALSRLETTGELTSRLTDKTTGKKLTKNRIITINNWNSYQGSDRQSDRQTVNQDVNQTTGKRQATRQSNDSRYKNLKNKRIEEEEKEYKEKENSSSSEKERLEKMRQKQLQDECDEYCRIMHLPKLTVEEYVDYLNGKIPDKLKDWEP